MKRLYLRDYEDAPQGAIVVTGRQGGRYFEYGDRNVDFTDWFIARPKLHTAHLKGLVTAATEPIVAATEAPATEEVVDEVAAQRAKRDAKNAYERERRARKKAEANG